MTFLLNAVVEVVANLMARLIFWRKGAPPLEAPFDRRVAVRMNDVSDVGFFGNTFVGFDEAIEATRTRGLQMQNNLVMGRGVHSAEQAKGQRRNQLRRKARKHRRK